MKADVVVIGGGIIGTSIAYHLSKFGVDVALFERSYISSGSTGRCAGGIRQQWSSPMNVRLAMESVRMFEKFKEEVGYDIEYYSGGYLLLAYTDEEVDRFKKQVKMQREQGLDVYLLSPSEVKKQFSSLNIDRLKLSAYCPTDGHANPHLANFAYVEAAKKEGARIYDHTEVTGIVMNGDRITGVITDKMGKVETKIVVNAAGAKSRDIAKMVGKDLPVEPYRHQILVTEWLPHVLDPLIVDFYHNIYFRQTMHGSFIMGQSDPDEKPGVNLNARWQFLHEISHKITFLMPMMENVSVVRQWAGIYVMSPDAQPIIDELEGVSRMICATGYSGHGFMLAPITGKLVAEWVIYGNPRSMDISNLSLKRFEGGKRIEMERNVV